MLREFTATEKSIAAAAYLQGLALGLACDRPKRFQRRLERSPLANTKVWGTVAELLSDGLASNPLAVYEMHSLAEACGLFMSLDVASEHIAAELACDPKALAR